MHPYLPIIHNYIQERLHHNYYTEIDPETNEITLEDYKSLHYTIFITIELKDTQLHIDHDHIETRTTLDLNDPNSLTQLDNILRPYYNPDHQ